MAKVAINGMGRIGRATFKIILDTQELELVAINDLIPPDDLAYLIQYDSVYGRYEKRVESDGQNLIIDGKKYQMMSKKDPSQLPWRDLGVDVVFECTGIFTKREDLEKHITAGAKYAILSAPSKSPDMPTVVYGVNRADSSAQIISCASCTTNCITPVVEIMGRRIGIKKATMTTVHAYTSTQNLVDGFSKKIRRGRAAAVNLVPTSTGAAIATTKSLPQYEGRFDGVAIRAPVPSGSIADIVFLAERETTADEVNTIFREEAESDRYRGVLKVAEAPLVSSDIIKDPHASVIDAEMTQVVDKDLVKIMSWYDNEWGYSCQMVKEGVRVSEKVYAEV
ncbi:MAG: type I glyceraldehyde-3-phosphate dehydrogenase [wastewater metagenome]|nr:type I glyceraldehyde-3-phosphate dehydrogenase [Candidatus Loosdrechtia aerotolerans]